MSDKQLKSLWNRWIEIKVHIYKKYLFELEMGAGSSIIACGLESVLIYFGVFHPKQR